MFQRHPRYVLLVTTLCICKPTERLSVLNVQREPKRKEENVFHVQWEHTIILVDQQVAPNVPKDQIHLPRDKKILLVVALSVKLVSILKMVIKRVTDVHDVQKELSRVIQDKSHVIFVPTMELQKRVQLQAINAKFQHELTK